MTGHWTLDYLGQNWTEETDCYYWVRKIQQERFGVTLSLYPNPKERKQWAEAESPKEGDVIFMEDCQKSPHVGVWVGQDSIIHAVKGWGVVIDSRANLELYGIVYKKAVTHIGTGKYCQKSPTEY